MIFSIGDHIKQIKNGTKTQTRRKTNYYIPGVRYSIQPRRGRKAISDGVIEITRRWEELKWVYFGRLAFIREFITEEDADAEGGYTPEEFEELYDEIYPTWESRWAYEFVFVPKE